MKTVLIATATGLVLCSAACSSSGGGSGSFANGGGGGGAPTTGVTSAGAPGSSTAQAGGGGVDANSWCQELAAAGPAVISAGNSGALPPDWQAKADALAADAPDAIRTDVQIVIKADEKIINGDPNGDNTPQFMQAGAHLVQWLSTNCPDVMKQYNPGLPGAGTATG
jgi:hypothetical protein